MRHLFKFKLAKWHLHGCINRYLAAASLKDSNNLQEFRRYNKGILVTVYVVTSLPSPLKVYNVLVS